MLFGQCRIYAVKFGHVDWSEVPHHLHPDKNSDNPFLLEFCQYFINIFSRHCRVKPSQAIVGTSFNNDDIRLLREYPLKTRKRIAAGLSTYPGIDHTILLSFLRKLILKLLRIASALINSLPGGKAVSQRNNSTAVLLPGSFRQMVFLLTAAGKKCKQDANQ